MSKKKKASLLTHTQRMIFLSKSSPLPDSRELKAYEQILPGISERLMTSYERQQYHRTELEKMVVKSGIIRSYLGQVFSFILGMLVISGGIFLILKGFNVAGYSLLVGTTTTLVGSFLYGKRQNRIERGKKSDENPIAY